MIKYWNLLQRCNQMHRINISTQSRLFKMMMEPLQGSMLQPARKPKFLIKKNERGKKKENLTKIQLMNSFVRLIAKRDLVVFRNDTQGLLKLSHNSLFSFFWLSDIFIGTTTHTRQTDEKTASLNVQMNKARFPWEQ